MSDNREHTYHITLEVWANNLDAVVQTIKRITAMYDDGVIQNDTRTQVGEGSHARYEFRQAYNPPPIKYFVGLTQRADDAAEQRQQPDDAADGGAS